MEERLREFSEIVNEYLAGIKQCNIQWHK
jgi:hypothetical protein